MPQTKKHYLDAQAALAVGRVRLASAGEYFIETEIAVYPARRAASLLMEVAPGDLVLAVVSGRQAWAVEVLERASDSRPTLRCDAGLEIAAGAEGLRVAGARLEFEAALEISSSSPAWTLETETARVRVSSLSLVGRAVNAALGRLRLAASVADSVVGRLTQRAKTALRTVDGLDRHRAGKLRVEVAEDWTLHAANAQLKAKGKVRVDGEKIDLG